MGYVKSWEKPDYPQGDWVDEVEWSQLGIDEIIEEASEAYEQEIEDLEEGFFAVYSENDIGCERLIPMEYSDNSFETVRGVFDSNPGHSQRYTSWSTTYTEEALEKELEVIDGKLVELSDEEINIIRENFPPYFERKVNMNTVMNDIAGVFWSK